MGALEGSEASGEEGGQDLSESNRAGGRRTPPGRGQIAAAAGAGALLLAVLFPLLAWQSENQQKALSQSNMRRIATGAQTYAEDWDLRLPPPLAERAPGQRVPWSTLVRPYVLLDEAFSNPSNPVRPFASSLNDPVDGHAIQTSYALNTRFWNTFGRGPFPIGNLEIPEQTVMLVEAGRMASDPRRPRLDSTTGLARDTYGDTKDRYRGLFAYPSVHGGQAVIVAVDGHAVITKVIHYTDRDGPHDVRLGRMGDGIYNWNGGHENGATDRPMME